MTKPLLASEVGKKVEEGVPGSVVRAQGDTLWVHPERLLEVCRLLKETPGLELTYLVAITGVDYIEYFEVVYHLVSIRHNHSLVLKVQVYGRDEPTVPSVVSVWQGADYQEREVYDLMGVRFAGHPNLKRILTWEGFPGHPLRKDHLGA
ncbi:MAG: NADH-quinone oxidoreductase subunit C [Dehalococcoidia bacterium]|nr:NADH-quinone oxidoreductase subunit C [Dehalococcoidia bacterium]MDW8119230.1 NADH-quinone oxidoreductase subunit C [Chloroflexota bacterium]